MRELRKARNPEVVEKLKGYCNSILHGELLGCLPLLLKDGTEVFQTPGEIQIERLTAAVALAEKVQLLISDTADGKRFRDLVAQEVRPGKGTPDARNSALAWEALMRFIRREKRLPAKKELNREANRLVHRIPGFLANKKFGEAVFPSRNDLVPLARADRYYVYSCFQNHAFDSNDEVVFWMECEIVPNAEWNELRWDESDYSKLLKAIGLSGLSKIGKRST